MKYLYRLYQLIIVLPLFVVITVITTSIIAVGRAFGNANFWGYHRVRVCSWLTVRLLFLPVTVEGRQNLKKGESYVFVANHQGAFDIFLIYGFLRRNFKWMMKRQIRDIPFVGFACKMSHQIFVDKRGPKRIKETYDKARATLREGMSVVVFPEGARSFTGHMGVFRKGAFLLADELQLPVVPLTINGSFNIMPRMRDGKWVVWHPLRLTIHEPIYPTGRGEENIRSTMESSYDVVMGGLVDEYKGFVENPDQ